MDNSNLIISKSYTSEIVGKSTRFLWKSFVYGIFDSVDLSLIYVGYTSAGAKRWIDHLVALRMKRHHNTRLQRFYNKMILSSGKLVFGVIEYCEKWELAKKETNWIEKCRLEGIDLYNQTDGGDSPPPKVWTDEAKLEHSKKMKGRPKVFSSEGLNSFIRKQKERIPTERQLEALSRWRSDPSMLEKRAASVRAARHKISKTMMGKPIESRRSAAKLTTDQVREIRRRYKPRDKKDGATALAREFDIDYTNIFSILNRTTWADVV